MASKQDKSGLEERSRSMGEGMQYDNRTTKKRIAVDVARWQEFDITEDEDLLES